MDGVVHVDSNFVNKKFTPLYPDRTLDKKIDKLCSKIDRLVAHQESETFLKNVVPPQKKKWPFWYLVIGVIVIFYVYFKITNLFKSNVTSVPQSFIGNRPGHAQVRPVVGSSSGFNGTAI